MLLESCSPWEGGDVSALPDSNTRCEGSRKGPSEVEPSGVTSRCWKWKVIREHEEVDRYHLATFILAQRPLGLSQMLGLTCRQTSLWSYFWGRSSLLCEQSGWLLQIILFLHLFERTKQAERDFGKSSSPFPYPKQSKSPSHKALTCHQRPSMREMSLSR